MRSPVIAFAAAALLASSAFAQEAPVMSTDIAKAPAGQYVLEKSHASITFKAMHMGLANYTMRFNDFDATIDLDPAAPEKSKLNVTIKPASLDANNPKMTAHTDNEDFFNVAKFPTITFVSTKIEKLTPTTGKIHGDMTMLGVTKPVVLDTTFNNGGAHPFFKKYALGFSATTTIKRSDFGMKHGIPMVGDDIPVAIEVEFIQK
jgi:polyisoprenoid-binding protein YceI